MKKLTPLQIDKKLNMYTGWFINKTHTVLSKTFFSKNYIDSLAYMARIVVYAEVFQHHPDIELTYGKIKIKLTSHDVQGITKKDFDMIQKIEKIFLERNNNPSKSL
jgi:4a-hydroxytetrahydrobiopterin dehydratase